MINVKNLVLGIGIIIVFGLALWQGIEAFYPSPNWEKYCGAPEKNIPVYTETQCTDSRGRWTPYDVIAMQKGLAQGNTNITGYCDMYYQCQKDYDAAMDSHSKAVFLISLIIGIITLIVGFSILSIEPVGSALMASGIWAIFWGTAINWRNISSIWRFLLLLLALILLVWITLKLNKAREEKKGFFRKFKK